MCIYFYFVGGGEDEKGNISEYSKLELLGINNFRVYQYGYEVKRERKKGTQRLKQVVLVCFLIMPFILFYFLV